jgi:hypothetical protein
MIDRAPLDFITDLQTRGCAVCNHLSAHARDFFAQYQYALGTDEEAQRTLAAQRNLCPVHLWQLEAISSHVSISLGLAPLVEQLARILDRAAQDPSTGLVPLTSRCRVCDLLRDCETDYLERLTAFLNQADGREVYAASHGLCLRHVAALVVSSVNDGLAAFLLRHSARYFARAAADMRAFAAKQQSLRRDLITDDEHDAYQRALTHFAGSRSYCAVPTA